jgi:hypothetical protein
VTSQFAVSMTAGTHTVRVELLSKDHREFTPAVAGSARVDVTGVAQPGGWVSCPGK